jgi:hypothetical protein
MLHSVVPHYHSKCESENGTHVAEQETSFQKLLSIVFSKYFDESHLEHVQQARMENSPLSDSLLLCVSSFFKNLLNAVPEDVTYIDLLLQTADITFIVNQYFSGILGHYSLTAPPAI